jgi:hypothetical protein
MEAEIIHDFSRASDKRPTSTSTFRLFRAQEKESFAFIAADAQLVRTALDPFHFDRRILAGLGLCPVVLLGLFDAKDADRQATRVHDWLIENAVPARILSSSRGAEGETASAVRELVHAGTISFVSLEAARVIMGSAPVAHGARIHVGQVDSAESSRAWRTRTTWRPQRSRSRP